MTSVVVKTSVDVSITAFPTIYPSYETNFAKWVIARFAYDCTNPKLGYNCVKISIS
jgi:hypothetical protein